MLGDLNCIRHDGKRIGGILRTIITIQVFKQYIDKFGLMELKTIGGSMSWTNGQMGRNR